MILPEDSFILLSYVNTQLRDNFSSLDDLCAEYGAERKDIERKLGELGYVYSGDRNAFVREGC